METFSTYKPRCVLVEATSGLGRECLGLVSVAYLTSGTQQFEYR